MASICPECGCDENNPWYCGCSDEDCPCYESDEDEEAGQ